MRRITLFAATAALLLGACSGDPLTRPPATAPLVIGPVVSVDHRATASGVLVEAGPGSQEPCGIQATIDADTRVLRRVQGRLVPADRGAVAPGVTVEVYVSGPVAESCPVQGYAERLVLVE